jgi:3-deoxy-D-manno-octulosonic acid kinase
LGESETASQKKVVRWQERVERMNADTTISAESAFELGETAGPRQFLWEPLAVSAREFVRAVPGTRWTTAILSGYARLLRAAKLWDTERRWAEQAVVAVRREVRRGLVRREWQAELDAILEGRLSTEPIGGGRGKTVRAMTSSGAVIIRRFRRGGAMRWAGETYFGGTPRPLSEFWVLLRARRRGLAVPDPVAAVVEPGALFTYRGLLVTSEISGAAPLWDHLRNRSDAEVPERLARSLRRLHDGGLNHPDLNLKNILVVGGEDRPDFAFVDLDRARLATTPIQKSARRRALRRIRRSARRLDPERTLVNDAWLERLERSYWTAP